MRLSTKFLPVGLAGLAILALGARPLAADLWLQGGFESSFGWTGTDRFMGNPATEGAAPNAATFFTLIGKTWITESGTWVEAPGHAYEGDRMFWLRNYADPDTICVGQQFANNNLAGSPLRPGNWYQLTWQFAAFNPVDPDGLSGRTSIPLVEMMTWNTAASRWDIREMPISFGNGTSSDPDAGRFEEFAVSGWDRLDWQSGTVNLQAPADTGQPVYLWVSMSNTSYGMLLDNIRLSAIPEPGVGLLAGVIALIAVNLRLTRRKILP